MERAALLIGAVSVGVLLAVGAAVVVFGAGDASDDAGPDGEVTTSFPAIDHDVEAAEELIEAWDRWRRATFVTTGTWQRELDSGGDPLSGPTLRVQEPPRRLVVRLGSTVERVDDVVAICDTDQAVEIDPPDCVEGRGGLGYDERVDREVATVSGYVVGDARAYDVDRGEITGCFRAEARRPTITSPWGRWAEFCFDAGSGALESSRIRKPSAVDTEITSSIRTEVTAADFAADDLTATDSAEATD